MVSRIAFLLLLGSLSPLAAAALDRGPGLDPSGLVQRGPGLDPSGIAGRGPGLDPSGRAGLAGG